MLSDAVKYQNKLTKVTNNLITSNSPAIKNIPPNTEQNRNLIRKLFDISYTKNYDISNMLKNQINSVVSYKSNNYIERFHKLVNWQSNRGESFKYLTLKYGEVEAIRRLKLKSENVKGSNNPAYQHDGKYSPWSKKFCKAGDYEGRLSKLKSKSSKTRQTNPQNTNTRIEYYLAQGLSKQDAEKSLSDRQSTFSKAKCIEIYGEIEGVKIWTDRQLKWQKTINSKPPEEILRINNLKLNGCVSKSSQKLFNELNIEKSQYFEQGGEKSIEFVKGKYYRVDFIYKNKIIEFMGDYWHCNPNKYTNDFQHPITKRYAHEIWEADLIRKTNLIHLGYEVLEIWESDYSAANDETIEKCRVFCNV